MFEILAAFDALSFYLYGITCLASARMAAEFDRYGLARFRAITGSLQLAGAVGVTLGLFGFPDLGFWAAAGLSLQMALGVAVRVRIRDRWYQCLPAFFYGCLNAFLAWGFLKV